MDFKHYQLMAYQFAVYPKGSNYPAIAIGEETGELQGVIAKAVRKGIEPDLDKVLDEAGDVLWNIAAILSDYDLSLEDAAEHNLQKLGDRKRMGLLDAVRRCATDQTASTATQRGKE